VPTSSTLLVFGLAALALVALPGPNLMYIAARSLGEGRRAGIASAFGVETGALVHIVAAVVGLSALVASSATAFGVLRYLGAAYLVFLGLRTLLQRAAPAEAPQARPVPLARAYAEGVVVNVLNPKVALFFLALLPQFVDPARGPAAAQILVLGLVFLAIALVLDLAYALAAGALRSRLAPTARTLARRRRFTGGVYLLLGAVAALSPSTRTTR